jgi:hypothetical protein
VRRLRESPPAPLDKGGAEAPAPLGRREQHWPEGESPPTPLDKGGAEAAALDERGAEATALDEREQL